MNPTQADPAQNVQEKRMNQQQFDGFKAELRQMFETRIERPLNQINTKLTLIEAKLKEHDELFANLSQKLNQIDE